MIRKLLIATTLYFFAYSIAVCQYGFGLSYAPSKVIKHRENLLFDVPSRSHELRLAYTYQTSGINRWERYWNNPRITINGTWVDFGDQEVLGNAFGILPELHFTLKNWKKLKINVQFGTGIAYLDKPYDAISNPNNNAIGSYLNNVSSLKMGFEYEWSEVWSTNISTGLVHFSNGLSSSPNSGINIYGVTLGGHYRFDGKKEILPRNQFDDFDMDTSRYRRWVVDVQFHYGFTELQVPGGPKYGVRAYSLGTGYRYGEYLTLYFGGEYEYNDAQYVFHKRNFYTEEEAQDRARRSSLYLTHEMRFGSVFNRIRAGFYLPWPISPSKTYYIKVSTGFYLPEIKGNMRPYIGILLKTHSAVADYLGVVMGISI